MMTLIEYSRNDVRISLPSSAALTRRLGIDIVEILFSHDSSSKVEVVGSHQKRENAVFHRETRGTGATLIPTKAMRSPRRRNAAKRRRCPESARRQREHAGGDRARG